MTTMLRTTLVSSGLWSMEGLEGCMQPSPSVLMMTYVHSRNCRYRFRSVDSPAYTHTPCVTAPVCCRVCSSEEDMTRTRRCFHIDRPDNLWNKRKSTSSLSIKKEKKTQLRTKRRYHITQASYRRNKRVTLVTI